LRFRLTGNDRFIAIGVAVDDHTIDSYALAGENAQNGSGLHGVDRFYRIDTVGDNSDVGAFGSKHGRQASHGPYAALRFQVAPSVKRISTMVAVSK